MLSSRLPPDRGQMPFCQVSVRTSVCHALCSTPRSFSSDRSGRPGLVPGSDRFGSAIALDRPLQSLGLVVGLVRELLDPGKPRLVKTHVELGAEFNQFVGLASDNRTDERHLKADNPVIHAVDLVVVHVLLLDAELPDDNLFSHLPVIQLLPLRHEVFNIAKIPAQVRKLPLDHTADLVCTRLPGFCQVPVLPVGVFTVHSRHGEIVIAADAPDDCLRLLPCLVQQGSVHGITDVHRSAGGIEDQSSAVWCFSCRF